jgi:hypothetical protein
LKEEFGGGFSWFAQVAAKLAAKKGYTEQKQISESSGLMAVALEAHFRLSGDLLELSDNPFSKAAKLFRYIGAGYITGIGKEATSETTGLPSALAQVVQDKRVERETAFREQFSDLGEDHAQTIVWTAQGRTAPGRPTALASIARKQ